MRLGLLTNDATHEAIKLISGHDGIDGIHIYKDGSISIDGDVSIVSEWLGREYNLHLLICDDNRYMVASIMEQDVPLAPTAPARPVAPMAPIAPVAADKTKIDPEPIEKQDPVEQMRNAIIYKLSNEKDPKKFKEMVDKVEDVMHRVIQDEGTRQKILAAMLEKLKKMGKAEVSALAGREGVK